MQIPGDFKRSLKRLHVTAALISGRTSITTDILQIREALSLQTRLLKPQLTTGQELLMTEYSVF